MAPPPGSGPLKAGIKKTKGPDPSFHAPYTATPCPGAICLRFVAPFIPPFMSVMARSPSLPDHLCSLDSGSHTALYVISSNPIASPPSGKLSLGLLKFTVSHQKNLFFLNLSSGCFLHFPAASETQLSPRTQHPQSPNAIAASSLTTFESLGQEVGYMLLLNPASKSFCFPPSKNKTPPALNLTS